MNEKDIYAVMARNKLAKILLEDNSNHGYCYCTICIAKRAKNHPENCTCNICITVREELKMWGDLISITRPIPCL